MNKDEIYVYLGYQQNKLIFYNHINLKLKMEDKIHKYIINNFLKLINSKNFNY